MLFTREQLRQLPHPALILVIAVCAVIYLTDTALGLDLSMRWGARPLTINLAWQELRAGLTYGAVWQQFATLLTAVFLHGSADHLVWNMVFFWTFGVLGVQLLGRTWVVLLVFLAAGLAGNVFQLSLDPISPISIIGASGGVSGLEGLFVVLALRWRLQAVQVWPLDGEVPAPRLVLFALIGIGVDLFYLGNRGAGVAYGAHVGGCALGALFGLLVTLLYRSPLTRTGLWR